MPAHLRLRVSRARLTDVYFGGKRWRWGLRLPSATFSSGLCGLRLAFPTWPSLPGRSSLRKHTQWPRGFPGPRSGLGGFGQPWWSRRLSIGGETRGWSEGHGWLKVASLASPWMFSLFWWWTGRGGLGPRHPGEIRGLVAGAGTPARLTLCVIITWSR